MKDFLGQEIRVGDSLAYPVRRRSAMWMAKIMVTDLGDGTVRGINDKGRRITLSKLERCIIIKMLCDYCGHNPNSYEG